MIDAVAMDRLIASSERQELECLDRILAGDYPPKVKKRVAERQAELKERIAQREARIRAAESQ